MKMTSYVVGDVVCAPSPDQIVFDLTDAGGVLLFKMNSPTAAEKRLFKRGLSFKHVIVDDIIFILTRLSTDPWMDIPYARQYSIQLTKLPIIEDGAGIAIHAMLIDAKTGKLVAQKLFSPSTDESRSLIEDIRNQPEIPDFDTRLARIYATYTTSELVEMAR